MPVSLDSCIADIFEPGNIPTDPGSNTPPHYNGYLLASRSVSGDLNGAGQTLGTLSTGSTALYLTVTGTWVGLIVTQIGARNLATITSNVSKLQIPVPSVGQTSLVSMAAYTSGTAHVTLTATDRIIIQTMTAPPHAPFFSNPVGPFQVGFLLAK